MTPNATDDTGIETTETSLTVRCTFDTPRERVFAGVTDREQVDRWWGPDGFSTTTDEMDVRPGGVWAFEMVGPDGEEYPNLIVYDEVEEPKRLTYTHGSPDDPEQFEVTVSVEDAGIGRTTLTMRTTFPSAEERGAAEESGAVEGAQQTLDHLAEHLANGGSA